MESLPARHLLTTLEDRLRPGRTSVLVVDMQNDYISVGGVKYRRDGTVAPAQAILEPLGSLLTAARRAGALVIYLKMTLDYPALRYSSDVDYIRRTRRYAEEPIVVAGTWGHAVAAEVAPEAGDLVVEKQRSSGFVGTNLDLILRTNRIESVIVTGVVTHGCVFATALSAMMNDYYVTVPVDCVAGPRPDLHEAALLLLGNYLQLDESLVPSSRIVEIWDAATGDRRNPSGTPAAGRS